MLTNKHDCLVVFLQDIAISVSVPEGDNFKTHLVIEDHVDALRGLWEETSFQLEIHQCNPQCAEQEKSSLSNRTTPKYSISFDCASTALPGIHKGMEELSIFSGCYDTFCGCIQGMPMMNGFVTDSVISYFALHKDCVE